MASNFAGSVVGKASTTGRGISPIHAHTPALIFTGGGQKYEIGVVFNIAQLWAARVWKCSKISEFWSKMQYCDYRPMFRPSLVKLGPRTPEKALSVLTGDNCTRKRAKSSTTQRWIIRFRSNCVWGLNAWHWKMPSKFEVQRSKVKVTAWHNVSA